MNQATWIENGSSEISRIEFNTGKQINQKNILGILAAKVFLNKKKAEHMGLSTDTFFRIDMFVKESKKVNENYTIIYINCLKIIEDANETLLDYDMLTDMILK